MFFVAVLLYVARGLETTGVNSLSVQRTRVRALMFDILNLADNYTLYGNRSYRHLVSQLMESLHFLY